MALINTCKGLWIEQWLFLNITGINAGERKKVLKAQNLTLTVTAEAARTLNILAVPSLYPAAPEAYIEKKVTFF